MKQLHENPNSKKIYRRIIENQIDGMTKNFCEIMDKYYQSIMNYREKCKERVQRQFEIGFYKKEALVFLIQ
jgi:t-SNARE complex subunit (syntaxin)